MLDTHTVHQMRLNQSSHRILKASRVVLSFYIWHCTYTYATVHFNFVSLTYHNAEAACSLWLIKAPELRSRQWIYFSVPVTDPNINLFPLNVTWWHYKYSGTRTILAIRGHIRKAFCSYLLFAIGQPISLIICPVSRLVAIFSSEQFQRISFFLWIHGPVLTISLKSWILWSSYLLTNATLLLCM